MAAGVRLAGFFSTAWTLKVAAWTAARAAWAAGLVGQVELGQAFAVILGHAGQERVGPGADVGLDGPVFLGAEGLDLDLAVDDQAQGHRLYAAGRSRARQLAPEHRREGEADQVVEGAAGQVGVDQLHVDVARVLHRLGDGVLGDGVEHHPGDLGALDGLLALQDFQHVPADRLAFAIGVGGQDQAVGAFQRLDDVVEPFVGLGVDLPEHLEVFVGLHRPVLRRQVADVPVRRQHLIVGAKVAVDGAGFTRAFDDDNVHAGRKRL